MAAIADCPENDVDVSCHPCEKHPGLFCQMWCTVCNEVVCDTCMDSAHKNCSFKIIKYLLPSLVADALLRLPGLGSKQGSKNYTQMLVREIEELRSLANKYENDKHLMELQITAEEINILEQVRDGDCDEVDCSIVMKLLKILKQDERALLLMVEPQNFSFMINFQEIETSCGNPKYTEKVIYQFHNFFLSYENKGNTYLSVFVHMEPLFADCKDYPVGDVEFQITLHNWECSTKSIRKLGQSRFENTSGWGFLDFATISIFEGNPKEWLVNGKICVSVRIFGLH